MEDSQEKDYSFLGNDTFPNLYDALVYERKFKSEYLERQIYERSLKSEPSIVKLIEKLSEPSIVKFIENQSEDLSKFVFKKISMIDIPQGCALAEPGGPWRLTFILGRLENLRFFLQIICRAP